jgi:hypothetical protein
MSNSIAGILLPLLVSAAYFPWLRTGANRPWSVSLALVLGTLTTALLGWLGTSFGLGPWLTGAAALLVSMAAGVALRLRLPLLSEATPVDPPAKESAPFQLGAWIFGLVLTALGAIFLWANAVHPPVLAGTLFHWSGPARGLGVIFGFPLRLSAAYYQFSTSDIGWKFLWSALSLLPWFAVAGALREQGKSRLATAAATLIPALAFALLFWASSGYPDLFLTGCVILVWTSALAEDRARRLLIIPPLLIIAWSGAYWGALAAIALLCASATERENILFRWIWTILAIALLARWAHLSTPDWHRSKAIVLYLARDAWNTARYGALAYLIAAVLARRFAFFREHALVLAGILATLVILALDVSGRSEADLQILLHVEANRAFACALLIAWPLALRLWPSRSPASRRV